MARLRLLAAALAATCFVTPAFAAAEIGADLQPYQMVRSLQLIQDKIAAGDHAALPMQRKILQMLDTRFQDTESEDYSDLRNYRAMLVYAMSGGNPKTIEIALARIHLDETNRSLGIGILDYLRGNPKAAKAVLHDVDPLKLPQELGAFFALVKGSVNAIDDPEGAMDYFDEARLLSPGTLVEEAALRRTLTVSATSHAPERFMRAAEAYVRRFLTSPYASQFADTFVGGIIELGDSADLALLDEIVNKMEPVQRKTVYLRLARRAAIDGFPGLAAFSSEKADAIEVEGFGPEGDPRAELYAALATVTSETVDDVRQQLARIDRSLLSPKDLMLLEAAEAMANEVVNVPSATDEPKPDPVAAAKPAGEVDEADLIPEGEEPEPAASHETAKAESELADPEGTAASAHAASDPAAKPAEPSPEDIFVLDARKKLEEIDELLGEAVQ
jgi:chemotaxis protein MotC